ncbi:MAG: DNA polymerase IV [Panacagrimonas sp.]
MRKIIHVDMDAFYASVEQRDDPSLRGRPVIVAWRGNRSVVVAASYEARPFGVRSAMPAVRAERLCPEAVFVAPDFTRYRAVSRAVREIFLRHTLVVEPLSLDEAYLDVTENLTGLATATEVAQTIRRQIREELQLTASAGVAPNKFLAKLASDWKKPDGLFVIRPERAQELIAPLSVSRIPGVGPVMNRKLAALDLVHIADLQAADVGILEQRFGRYGRRLHKLAHGIDEKPVSSDRERISVSAEDTFEEDLHLDQMEPHIRRMAERTWDAATKLGRPAHTVVLKLKTSDFRILTRSITQSNATDSADALAQRALALRERVSLPSETRYRLVGVGLSGFVSPDIAPTQPELFAEDEPALPSKSSQNPGTDSA